MVRLQAERAAFFALKRRVENSLAHASGFQ
jgi:hypothetical protein